jgi:hypothetical protein
LTRDRFLRDMPTGPTDGGGDAREPTVTDGFGFFFRTE